MFPLVNPAVDKEIRNEVKSVDTRVSISSIVSRFDKFSILEKAPERCIISSTSVSNFSCE